MKHSLQIISECLTNVEKHARADKVWITVFERNNGILLEIRDNGVGFNTELIGKQAGRYGILGIQERARLIGGGRSELPVFRKALELSWKFPFIKEIQNEPLQSAGC